MFAGAARRVVGRLLFRWRVGGLALSRLWGDRSIAIAVVAMAAVGAGWGTCVGVARAADGDSVPVPAPASAQPAPKGGREVPQLRTQRSRTWVMPDGSYQTREYLHPVNYLDRSGGWQPIDNHLVASGTGWHSAANRYQLSVPQSLGSGAVKLSDGSQWVAFTLEGSDATGTVSGNQATFANAKAGVTARWAAYNTAIKEALVLRDAQAATRFTFDVSLSDGLSLRQAKDGGVAVVGTSGHPVFGFQSPYAVDASGSRAPTDAVSLSAAQTAVGAWTMTLSIDPTWVQATGRAFPVTVDPTVDIHPAQDCFLDGQATTTSYCADSSLWVGWDNDGVLHDHRSLMTFDDLTDSLPAASTLLNATLWMYETGETSPGTAKNLSVHRLTDAWTNDATWLKRTATSDWAAPGGDFDDTAEDSQPLAGAGNWMQWTVTNLVKQWIDGTHDNDGLAVVDDSDHVDNAVTFASSDAADQDEWPELDLTWWPRVGELPGDTFTSQQLTDRSLAKVNVANGNLLLDNQDTHIAGRDGMDVDVHRYFNSLDPWDGKLGYGWRFNVSEDIVLYDCDENQARCLIGPSGYRARFKQRSDGSYISPPGVEKSLVHNSDGTWTMTDHRSGEQWHFFDNSWTFQTSAKDRHGNEIDYQTDSSGLDDIADTRGHFTSVSANTAGDATSMEDFYGRTWSYGYVTGNRLLNSVTDPDGNQTQYGYDTQDRLSTITDPRGSVTTIGYDAQDRVHTVTRQVDATGTLTTTYVYGSPGSDCTQDEVGQTMVTDPRGNATTYCWDRNGRVLQTVDGAGYPRSSSYTANGDQSSFTDLTGTAAATATFDFDTDSSDDPTNNLKDGTFGAGETFKVGYCDPAASSGPTQCSAYAQHAYQPVSVTGPNVANRYFGYNATGDLTSVKDSTTSPTNQATLHYNSDGTIDTATDGNGNVTTFGYNGLSQLTSITPNTVTSSNPLKRTTYGYDTLGRVVQVSDGNHASGGYEISDVDYDGEDHVTEIDFGDGSWIKYGYDGNGNQTSRTDSAGRTTTYVYDRSNRRTSETFPGAITNTYGYDGSGNLASITDASGSTSYHYDAADRVDQITQPDGSQFAVAYSGPTAARPRWTKLTYPGNVFSQTTYTDKSGKTSQIVLAKTVGGTTTTLRSLTYDYLDTSTTPSTPRQQAQSVTDQDNNVTSYTYDSVGRLREAQTKDSSHTVTDDWVYTYDDASNRTKAVETTSSGTTTTSFGYNRDNVLCWRYNGTASSSDCSSPPSGASTYGYDASGNQTAGPSSFTGVYDVANRLTTLNSSALDYLSATNTELTAVGSTTYTNNLLGLASQTTGGATTRYTRAPDGTLLAQHNSSGTQYVTDDLLGSTRGLFTASSSDVDRDYSYDPDGNATSSGSGATTTIKFAGGLDIGSGLIHFGERYYQPDTARWTQADPVASLSNLQQANPYVYAGGDPVNLTDPDGTCIIVSCHTYHKAAGYAAAGLSGIGAAAVGIATTAAVVGCGGTAVATDDPFLGFDCYKIGAIGYTATAALVGTTYLAARRASRE